MATRMVWPALCYCRVILTVGVS